MIQRTTRGTFGGYKETLATNQVFQEINGELGARGGVSV
jgi:hypothetical protein